MPLNTFVTRNTSKTYVLHNFVMKRNFQELNRMRGVLKMENLPDKSPSNKQLYYRINFLYIPFKKILTLLDPALVIVIR